MKKLSVFWLLLCIVLIAAPTLAQDTAEEPPMATFGDETGLFTVQYPAHLFVASSSFFEAGGIPFPGVALTSSADIFLRSQTPPYTPVAVGDWGVAIILFHEAMFMQMGVAEDASLIDLATTWHSSFGPNARFTIEPHLITLENDKEAVVFGSIGDDGAGGPPVEENYLMLHEIAEGVIALTALLSAVDGRTEDMIAAHLAMTNSLEFTGTAEDLLATMPTGQ
jgi:hypothetical protein